jgi:hypothetical protein
LQWLSCALCQLHLECMLPTADRSTKICRSEYQSHRPAMSLCGDIIYARTIPIDARLELCMSTASRMVERHKPCDGLVRWITLVINEPNSDYPDTIGITYSDQENYDAALCLGEVLPDTYFSDGPNEYSRLYSSKNVHVIVSEWR